MKAPVFPVFTLQTYKNLVVFGGGGGNANFGKKNGVGVLDETTLKDIAYIETEDIILELKISNNDLEIPLDEDVWTEYSTTDLNLSKDQSTKSDLVQVNKIESNKFYLACKGDSFFYLMKYQDSTVNIVKKIACSIDFFLFNKHMFIVFNKKLFCIPDVVTRLDYLNQLLKSDKKIKFTPAMLQEEYEYPLTYHKDNIFVRREEGTTDVPQNWEKFFIYKNKIHKVIKEGNQYVFVLKSKKYTYDNEIRDIYCTKDGHLVLYTAGVHSCLIFITDKLISHSVDKITCMSVHYNFVSVGTGDGYGILFHKDKEFCKRRLSDFSITGISYRGGYFYYSSFDGIVNRKKAFTIRQSFVLLIALLLVFISILVAYSLK